VPEGLKGELKKKGLLGKKTLRGGNYNRNTILKNKLISNFFVVKKIRKGHRVGGGEEKC